MHLKAAFRFISALYHTGTAPPTAEPVVCIIPGTRGIRVYVRRLYVQVPRYPRYPVRIMYLVPVLLYLVPVRFIRSRIFFTYIYIYFFF